MRAFILAAGLGTRLRPLTNTTPKPMLPVGDKPLLEHQLLWMKRFGVTECVLNTYYLPEKIENYFGDGSRLGMQVRYIRETVLSGTAGPLQKLPEFFSEPFLVLYGDNLTTIDISRLEAYHKEKGGCVTIALYQEENIESKGMVVLDPNGRIQSFTEKPRPEEVISHLANAGVYLCQPDILHHIPKQGFCDFGQNLFPKLLADDIELYGYIMNEYLLDIGSPESYQQAQIDVRRLRLP